MAEERRAREATYAGLCRRGPYDGEERKYFKEQMEVYGPVVRELPIAMADPTKMRHAKVGSELLGTYIWMDGLWMWNQARLR